MEIQSKYDGNKPSKLGEIVQLSNIYFTEPAAAGRQRGGYFYSISTVFLIYTFQNFILTPTKKLVPACG